MTGRALYLWLIVVISVRQSTVAAISGLHCRAGYGQFEHKADSLVQNSKKRAERSERLMYGGSHRDYLRSGYLHHRLPVFGLLIITVITPLPTKPSATKMPENWSWRTRQNYWHADASAWCCCARCKIHEELADAKAEMMASAWWCCRWSSSVAHQSSLSVSAWSYPPPPAWIMQPPRLADTAERDYFTLREADHMQKQLEGTHYINEQCR